MDLLPTVKFPKGVSPGYLKGINLCLLFLADTNLSDDHVS